MRPSYLPVPLLMLVAGLAACSEIPELASAEQGLCGLGCGGNGGVIDGVAFWELDLGGEKNKQEVRLEHFALSEADAIAQNWRPLDVERARLRSWNAVGTEVAHGNLVGSVLVLSVDGHPYYLKIAEVSPSWQLEQYWTAGVAAGGNVETYRFQWTDPKAGVPGRPRYQDLCPDLTAPGEPWKSQVHALVFEGDRYKPETREVVPSPLNGWFNIACVGGTPAKMHLVRRTAASSSGVITTTVENDRQAFARMWAADYCGTGFSFTETGHPLRVRDKKGWIPWAGPVGFSAADAGLPGFSYEAVWDAKGAVCLETPRLIDAVPDLEDQIKAACMPAIPKCSSLPWFPANWRDHGQILTANPAP